MSVRARDVQLVPTYKVGNISCIFYQSNDREGFGYHVVITQDKHRIADDWLESWRRPSLPNAAYFLNKYEKRIVKLVQ